jgi:hypothetical protein
MPRVNGDQKIRESEIGECKNTNECPEKRGGAISLSDAIPRRDDIPDKIIPIFGEYESSSIQKSTF